MTEMYQLLTGDSSMTAVDEQVRLKLKFVLDSQDPDVINNLRDINPGRRQKYEQFWKEWRPRRMRSYLLQWMLIGMELFAT